MTAGRPQVFLNGSFVSRDDARVSAFDAGLQHGVGLFETMLAVRDPAEPEGHRVIGAREHVERLRGSAAELGLSDDLRVEPLIEAVVAAAARSGLGRARLRLTVTGGDLNMLESSGRSQQDPTILIAATPATEYPAAFFDKGVRVGLASVRLNPLDPSEGHKTLNYWTRLRELQLAGARGASEAIVSTVTNHLAGGCVSNLVAIHGDVAITPIARGEEAVGAVPSPVLPGVTRCFALGWLEEMGVEVKRQMTTIDDVLDAEEVILTNSSWGVLPVTAVEGSPIGRGAPGVRTRTLIDRWRELAMPGG